MHHNTQCSRVCCVGVQSESSIIACIAHGTRSIHQHRRRHLAAVQFTQKSAPRQRRNDGIYSMQADHHHHPHMRKASPTRRTPNAERRQ